MTHSGAKPLTRYAWLSIAAAVATISIKSGAYFITDSVGLLSDAMESCINLAGALMALFMLKIAVRPPDADHPSGHHKAEYFSSGVEGILIIIAAVAIIITSVQRLLEPRPLEQIGFGLILSVGASVINLVVALILLKAGKQYHSITLEADAKHLLTDVWTSAGVLVGIGAVALTGLDRLDPIVAILVAANIVWSGYGIMRKTVAGLMDSALSAEDLHKIDLVLESYKARGIQFHAIITRQSGFRQFVSFHVLVPGAWTVTQGHELLESIESDLHHALPNVIVITHLESLDDPASWDDVKL